MIFSGVFPRACRHGFLMHGNEAGFVWNREVSVMFPFWKRMFLKHLKLVRTFPWKRLPWMRRFFRNLSPMKFWMRCFCFPSEKPWKILPSALTESFPPSELLYLYSSDYYSHDFLYSLFHLSHII
jgi:hypothetical protein